MNSQKKIMVMKCVRLHHQQNHSAQINHGDDMLFDMEKRLKED